MEPKRFEEHIKEQLQKREIRPAADSWDKLEARLEQGDKVAKPKFLWVGIAAAIAGIFFFLGTLLDSGAEPAVVEQTSEEIIPGKSVVQPETEVLIASEKQEKPEVSIPEPLAQKKRLLQEKKIIVTQKKPVENAIFEVEEIEIDFSESRKAIAEVTPEPSVVSDAEVDALLNRALSELGQNKSSYTIHAIDPEELLYEVEYELEQGFRQKVFEVLKEGFSRARTAVANRNY